MPNLDYEKACTIFKGVRPVYNNKTYTNALKIKDKALGEKAGNYWKEMFVEHIRSHYV